jgi:hypothetical protein
VLVVRLGGSASSFGCGRGSLGRWAWQCSQLGAVEGGFTFEDRRMGGWKETARAQRLVSLRDRVMSSLRLGRSGFWAGVMKALRNDGIGHYDMTLSMVSLHGRVSIVFVGPSTLLLRRANAGFDG